MNILGIDLGTTGLKAVLTDESGKILGIGYRQYPLDVPHRGFAEQSPQAWYDALCHAVREVLDKTGVCAGSIGCVGFSGQMHGLVALDRGGNVLCPAIIHCDGRAFREKSELCSLVSTEQFGEWTQNRPNSGFQVLSLMWLRHNRPEIYEKIDCVLLPKDYLRFRLTGEKATEVTDACSTLMFDTRRRCWSEGVIEAARIDRAILPSADHYPYEIAGSVTKKAAAETGLAEGTRVSYGGGDTPMTAIGNGILSAGEASISIGTAGQLLVASDSPKYDPLLRTHTFCHAKKDGWYIMGAILNACLAQNWFDEKVLNDGDYIALGEGAEKIPAGSKGLLFLPYLTGERTPHMNEHASGAFLGLTLEHDRFCMQRAVQEGVAFALKDCLQIIRGLDIPLRRILISGGGAKSALWRQIVADVFEMPLYQSAAREQASMGAVICAQIAAGIYGSLEEACRAQIEYSAAVTEPNPSNFSVYREAFALYQEAYAANCTLFERLRRL